MYFKPEGFELYELLPKEFYQKMHPEYGDRLWSIFPARALATLYELRKKFGTIYMNNWYWGGRHQWRGLRTEDCDFGSELSQHRFANAFDMVFKYYDAEQIRRKILINPNSEEFQFISAFENDVSWLHIDFRQTVGMDEAIWRGFEMTFIRRRLGIPF